MAIVDLYFHSEHRRNLAHFASLASLAAAHGEVNPKQKGLLDRFALKLDITSEEYKEVMKKSNQFPITPSNSLEERLERLYDLFKLIYVDYLVDDEEMVLLKKYAIGLGFPVKKANHVIEKSVAIFSGRFNFDDYLYILKH